MKRTGLIWGLVLALVLSLGVNLGILAMLGMQRLERPVTEAPTWQGPPQQQLDRLADWMQLDEQQRPAFLDLQRAFFRGMHENGQDMRQLHGQLRRQLTSRNPDRQQVDVIVTQLADRFEQRERLMVETVLQSHELLDRRQRRQYQLFFARALRRSSIGAGPPPGLGAGDGPRGRFGLRGRRGEGQRGNQLGNEPNSQPGRQSDTETGSPEMEPSDPPDRRPPF